MVPRAHRCADVRSEEDGVWCGEVPGESSLLASVGEMAGACKSVKARRAPGATSLLQPACLHGAAQHQFDVLTCSAVDL